MSLVVALLVSPADATPSRVCAGVPYAKPAALATLADTPTLLEAHDGYVYVAYANGDLARTSTTTGATETLYSDAACDFVDLDVSPTDVYVACSSDARVVQVPLDGSAASDVVVGKTVEALAVDAFGVWLEVAKTSTADIDHLDWDGTLEVRATGLDDGWHLVAQGNLLLFQNYWGDDWWAGIYSVRPDGTVGTVADGGSIGGYSEFGVSGSTVRFLDGMHLYAGNLWTNGVSYLGRVLPEPDEVAWADDALFGIDAHGARAWCVHKGGREGIALGTFTDVAVDGDVVVLVDGSTPPVLYTVAR